ncbi:BapA/Bap/LapF family large adhesin [Psychrobacter sp. UBA6766]|uniref:BapA/Bap/LapF family large adhesin n=1 Tax=Psychrobacter sp. UBA6766 TaxID=1947361 RepID=UPI002600384E|nr:BapA/Bap/LapF family large adhesin [Psychrobacter sp. UBA6766]
MVDEDGNFEVDLNPPQVDGEEIEATLTDPAGNTSDSANVSAPDITAPDAPTEVTIGNGDAFITADEIDAEGNVDVVVGLPNSAAVGDTLIISGNGEMIRHVLTQVDLDNTEITVQLPAPAEGESLDVVASLADSAGNQSDPTNGSATRDTIAPDETSTFITIDPLTDDNVINKAESERDVAVTGTVEGDFTAGDTVTVTVNGQNYESTVAADGTFSIAVSGDDLVNDSQVIVTVTATDAAGNVGQVSKTQDYDVDLIAPSAPADITIGNGDAFITADEIDAEGNVSVVVGLPDDAEVGDTINVNGKEQALTEDDIINGEVVVKLPAPTKDATLDVTANLTDPAGNQSDTADKSFERDTTPPNETSTFITIDPLTDDNVINKAESERDVAVTGTVEGDFTVGDIVTVTVNGQNYESTVAADGTFNITVSGNDLANDSQVVVTVTATDAAGNVGQVSKTQDYDVDLIAPSAPTDITIGNGDDYITADEIDAEGNVSVVVGLPDNAEVGDTLIVNGNGTSEEHVLTQDDLDYGNVTVQLPAPAEGESLDVTASLTDPAGNQSAPSPQASATRDTIAPSAPTDITVGNGDEYITADEIVDGNVDVVVGLPDDAEVGDALIVSGNGTSKEHILTQGDLVSGDVTVQLPAPEEGESLDVTANLTDPAGNASNNATGNSGIVDTTPPNAPTDITIGNGDAFITADEIIDGNVNVVVGLPEDAEVGGSVVVNGQEQEIIAEDIEAGNITVKVPAPIEGEELQIIASVKDPAGNKSETVEESATRDTANAPRAPESVTIGNGDEYITANEIDGDGNVEVVVGLAADAAVGGILVINSNDGTKVEHELIQADIDIGNVTVQLPAPVEDGKLIASANIKVGNEVSTSITANAIRDTIAPDETSTSVTIDPLTDDNVINKAESEGEVAVTGTVEGDFTVGDTVIITVNGQSYESTVAADGTFSIDVSGNDLANDSQVVVTITATDAAGNVGQVSETQDYAVDLVAPSAPTDITVGNGDAFITADEIDAEGNVDVVVGLPDDAEVGDTINVNGQEQEITAEDMEAGNITIKVPAPIEGEELEITASVKDPAGNLSDPTVGSATRDTIAPSAPTDITVGNGDAYITADEIDAEGNVDVVVGLPNDAEVGDILIVSGNGASEEHVLTQDDLDSGDVTVQLLAPAEEESLDVTANLTDPAGNVSDDKTVNVGIVDTTEIIAAADNFVDLQLNADPLEIVNDTPSDLNKTGFTVVGASLGPVLGAGVAADVVKNSVVLEVGEDQVREVTVKGNAGGIQVAGTMDLSLYKLNESTNEWELQEVKENWVVSYLLGGVSKDTDFSLDEGQWLFVMSGGEGISALTGYTLQFEKDVVLDYSEATAISGSVTGNILADDDSSFSYDELPSGTTVTSITSPDGIQEVESGNTIVQGQYGTLTISPNGNYEYSVNEDFRGPYGSEESFTYTVTSPDGNTASAELTIELNILPADKQIKVDESLVIDAEPTAILDTENSEINDAVGFGVLDLSFGSSSVLDLELLGGKPPLEFTVGDNQVRELTLHGSAGGVELAKTYSMAVYKLDEDTGQYVQVHFEKNWFNAPFLGGKSNPLTLQFSEGDYKAVLLTAGGVGVLSGNGLYVDRDIIYDYDQPSEFMGEITGDATPDADTVILKVGEEHITSDATMTVQGQYGQLTIDANGNYTYSVSNNATDPAWQPPYGEVDSFRLVTQDADGKAAVETLNIKIGTHTAVDDFNNLQVSEQNLETSEKVIDGVSAATKNISRDFTVAEDTLTSATLKVDTTTIGTRLEYSIIDADTGEVVSTNKGNVSRSLDVTIDNLAPGNYTIEIKRVAGLGHLRINGSKFTIKSFHLDDYMASDIAPVEGLLLENDAGIGNIAELKVGSKSVFISDPNQGAKSIDIEGLYGTLTVNKDGSYSYVPNGKEFGVENFTYETISVTGVKETATLEINVGKNIAASIYDDTAISSAADDSFTMGAGADTVIFTNLGGTEGGNGNNGLDTWTDFDAAQGDKIDISELLDGSQTASNINNYLAYENGVLMVDRNGNSEFEALLEVTATDLDALLGSIEWQADTAGISTFSIGAIGEDTISLVDSNFNSPLVGLDEAFDDFDLTQEAQNISLSDLLEPEVIDISGSGITTLAAETSDGTADLQSSDWAGKEHISMNGSEQANNAWQIDSTSSSQFYIDTDIAHVI